MFKLTVSSKVKKSASIPFFAQYLYNEDILVLNCILYQSVFLFFCTCIVHFEHNRLKVTLLLLTRSREEEELVKMLFSLPTQ